MPTLQEQIDDLTDNIDDLSTSLAQTLSNLNTARTNANDAADAANAAADVTTNPNLQTTVFIDAVNGDDANAGTSVGAPIKTWQAMLGFAKAGQRLEVRMMSDLTADYIVLWKNPPHSIRFTGVAADGVTVTQRKMTFVDASNLAAYAGGLYSLNSLSVETFYVDFEMAHTRSWSPVYVRAGRLELKATTGTITRTGTGDPLFNADGSAHFEVASIVIDASATGHVVDGIAAGGDPNTRDGYSANFTSA